MKTIFLAFAFGIAMPSFAQDAPYVVTYPIDEVMNLCIKEADYKEEAIARCMVSALKEWKTEVEDMYLVLSAAVPEANKKKLAESQKQWEAYAAIEGALARGLYSDKGKYPFGVVPLSRSIDIMRSRYADLKEYYDLLRR